MAEGKNQQLSLFELLKGIQQGTIKSEDLTTGQYLACVEHLRFEEGWSRSKIARFLKRDRYAVAKRINAMEEKRTIELRSKGIDVYKMATRLMWTTDVAMAKAEEEKDWRLYIECQHKLIDKLQALGVLYQEPVKLDVNEGIMTAVLKALEPYMEARLAVSDALERLSNGHDN